MPQYLHILSIFSLLYIETLMAGIMVAPVPSPCWLSHLCSFRSPQLWLTQLLFICSLSSVLLRSLFSLWAELPTLDFQVRGKNNMLKCVYFKSNETGQFHMEHPRKIHKRSLNSEAGVLPWRYPLIKFTISVNSHSSVSLLKFSKSKHLSLGK